MTEFNLTTFSVLFYRLGIIAAGTFIVFLGFKLLQRSLFREGTHTDIDAVWGNRKLLIRRAAPGTLFAALGSVIICFSIVYGPTISFKESPPAKAALSTEKKANVDPSSKPSNQTDSPDNNKKEKRTSLEKEQTVHLQEQEGKIPSSDVKEGDKTSSEYPWKKSENPHSPAIEEPSTWGHRDKTVTTRKKQKSYKPRTREYKTVFPSESVESDVPYTPRWESEKEVDPVTPVWKSEEEWLQFTKKLMGIEEEAEEPSNTPQSEEYPKTWEGWQTEKTEEPSNTPQGVEEP